MFYLNLFVAGFDGWLAAAAIVVTCPLMISGYKSYKTHVSHALAASFVRVAFGTSFLIAFTGLL